MFIRGLPVRDSKKPLSIEIKKSDVSIGGVKTPSKCAAARAICRNPDMMEALVHLSVAYVRPKGTDHWLRFKTPHSLRQEIVTFDRGGTFSPGSFTLPRPNPSIHLGEGKGSDTSRNKPRHLKQKREVRHLVTGVRPHASTERDHPAHVKKG